MRKQLSLDDLSVKAAKSTKTANTASAISAGVMATSSVFSIISDISDRKQRALFENNFNSLTADQKKKLEERVASVNSADAKLGIIANTLTQLSVARITSQAGLVSEEEKKKRNQMIVIGGVMIATGLIITIIIIKKL